LIIKSKSYKHRRCYKTVTEYILRDIEKNDSFVLTRFIKGKDKSPQAIAKQLEHNESYRIHKRSNNVKLFMEIISFHKQDTPKLDNKTLEKIAKKYIAIRSELAISVATVHRDKKHTHLHILFSGVQYRTGKSIRLSKSEFKEKKLTIESFTRERYPQLKRSEIDHQKPSSLKKN